MLTVASFRAALNASAAARISCFQSVMCPRRSHDGLPDVGDVGAERGGTSDRVCVARPRSRRGLHASSNQRNSHVEVCTVRVQREQGPRHTTPVQTAAHGERLSFIMLGLGDDAEMREKTVRATRSTLVISPSATSASTGTITTHKTRHDTLSHICAQCGVRTREKNIHTLKRDVTASVVNTACTVV